MTLEDLLTLTRRRLRTVLAGVVIGMVIAIGLLLASPARYSASAVAYVRVTLPSGEDLQSYGGSYYMASQLTNQKVKAIASVITSEAVAQEVVDSLGLTTTASDLASRVSADNPDDQLTITVTASAPTPGEARRVADEVVKRSAAQVRRLEGEDAPIEVILLTPASLSATTKQPSALRLLAAGLLGGLVVGYVAAAVQRLLDKRVRSSEDVAKVLDAPVLGAIPLSTAMIAGHNGGSSDFRVEEALRKLRTNLRYASVDRGLRSLVISSAVQGEGKSTVATNLARVMALAGTNVVLIEGDLRRPLLREAFTISPGRPGLAQLLLGAASLDSALASTSVPGLHVIVAGDTPPNPSELLGSTRLSELIEYLAQDQLVIIDAPPVLPVTDAVALAEHTDGLLMVVRAGLTTTDQLREAVESVGRGGGRMLGIVLNQITAAAAGSMYGESAYTSPGYSSHLRSSAATVSGNPLRHPLTSVAGSDSAAAGSRPGAHVAPRSSSRSGAHAAARRGGAHVAPSPATAAAAPRPGAASMSRPGAHAAPPPAPPPPASAALPAGPRAVPRSHPSGPAGTLSRPGGASRPVTSAPPPPPEGDGGARRVSVSDPRRAARAGQRQQV